jgi:hypothetical protein
MPFPTKVNAFSDKGQCFFHTGQNLLLQNIDLCFMIFAGGIHNAKEEKTAENPRL